MISWGEKRWCWWGSGNHENQEIGKNYVLLYCDMFTALCLQGKPVNFSTLYPGRILLLIVFLSGFLLCPLHQTLDYSALKVNLTFLDGH